MLANCYRNEEVLHTATHNNPNITF